MTILERIQGHGLASLVRMGPGRWQAVLGSPVSTSARDGGHMQVWVDESAQLLLSRRFNGTNAGVAFVGLHEVAELLHLAGLETPALDLVAGHPFVLGDRGEHVWRDWPGVGCVAIGPRRDTLSFVMVGPRLEEEDVPDLLETVTPPSEPWRS